MAKLLSTEIFAVSIVKTLQAAGHRAYYAGGCVRDRLMGRVPKDYDVATSATPPQVLALFPRSQMVGAAFGVVLVRKGRDQVEVATFRADGTYTDGRHPDEVRFTTPEEDAQRRDFTCNGLFFDPLDHENAGRLHDFVGGQRDIADRILRAIGDPALRFGEDHLRMLRAVRFAARLEFTMEPATRAAIDRMQSRIATISRERIGEEIRNMLEHPTRIAATTLLAGFPDMFAEVFGLPFNPPTGDIAWKVLSGLPPVTSRALALMAIMQDMEWIQSGPDAGKHIDALRAKLVLSNEETDAMKWMEITLPALQEWETLSKATLKRLMARPQWKELEHLYCADPNNADELFAFHDRIAVMEDEKVSPPPLITGKKLINLGAAPGPAFKRWLDELYDRQLNGELTTPAQAMEAAQKLLPPPPPHA